MGSGTGTRYHVLTVLTYQMLGVTNAMLEEEEGDDAGKALFEQTKPFLAELRGDYDDDLADIYSDDDEGFIPKPKHVPMGRVCALTNLKQVRYRLGEAKG